MSKQSVVVFVGLVVASASFGMVGAYSFSRVKSEKELTDIEQYESKFDEIRSRQGSTETRDKDAVRKDSDSASRLAIACVLCSVIAAASAAVVWKISPQKPGGR